MKRVYIDMDRTLVDYDGGFNKIKNAIKYPQSKIGFWLDLSPIQGAIESFKYLESKYDVWILTRPSFHNFNSYSEKAQWVREKLGFEAQKRTILCGDKSLVKGQYLIDDDCKNGQPYFEGIWIQFGSTDYPTWQSVVKKIDLLENL